MIEMIKKNALILILIAIIILMGSYFIYGAYQNELNKYYKSGALDQAKILIQEIEQKGYIQYTKIDGNIGYLISDKYFQSQLKEILKNYDLNKGVN